MNIDTAHLRQYVIEPTLQYLNMHSLAAIHVLEGVASYESQCNPFSSSGEGLGMYQISSVQHRSVWDTYLTFNPELASLVRGLASQRQFLTDPDSELITNLRYSTAIAWMLFLQSEASGKTPESKLLNPYWYKLYVDELEHQPPPLAQAV